MLKQDASGYKSRTAAEAGKAAKTPGSVEDYDMRIAQRVGQAINDNDLIKAAEYADIQARLLDMLNKGQISNELYAAALTKVAGHQGIVSDEAERFNKLLASTPSAKMEEARKDMEALARAFEDGRISEEQFIETAQTRVGQLGAGIKEVDDFARQMGLTFSSAFEDAIVGGKGLSDVLKGLLADIERIVIRKAVTEPVGETVSGWIKDSGITDSLKGTVGSLFGGWKASGGPLDPGKWYIAGEKGPEPVWGGGPGAFATGYGAGGVSIVQHINIDSRSDRASIAAAMVQAKDAAKAEILASMQRGGAFA